MDLFFERVKIACEELEKKEFTVDELFDFFVKKGWRQKKDSKISMQLQLSRLSKKLEKINKEKNEPPPLFHFIPNKRDTLFPPLGQKMEKLRPLQAVMIVEKNQKKEVCEIADPITKEFLGQVCLDSLFPLNVPEERMTNLIGRLTELGFRKEAKKVARMFYGE